MEKHSFVHFSVLGWPLKGMVHHKFQNVYFCLLTYMSSLQSDTTRRYHNVMTCWLTITHSYMWAFSCTVGSIFSTFHRQKCTGFHQGWLSKGPPINIDTLCLQLLLGTQTLHTQLNGLSFTPSVCYSSAHVSMCESLNSSMSSQTWLREHFMSQSHY